MFTGIVEDLGSLEEVVEEGGNRRMTFASDLAAELHVDQSISVNGVCLTVETRDEKQFSVSAISESLKKSTLAGLEKGDPVDLERAMAADSRFDGHIVQGHVDTTACCLQIMEKDGSWEFRFELDAPHEGLIIPKGSITVDGVSLTVINPDDKTFTVAIIPYTYEHTRFGSLREGDHVNVEFDVLGKYVQAQISAHVS